ncbi:MAG: hypothetical protein U0Q18_16705 [Bryobacteraceae bacterium]
MTDQEKDPVVHSSLSKPLFISSALLVICLGWALYDEVYGTRPWKGYQARFEKAYSRFLRKTAPGEASLEKQIKASAEYQKLTRDMLAAEKSVYPQVSEIDRKVSQELVPRLLALNEPFQEVRSHVGALTYQIEITKSQSTKESLRAEIAELKKEVHTVKLPKPDGSTEKLQMDFGAMDKTLQDWKAEKAALLQKRVDLMKPATGLRAQRDKYLADRIPDVSAETLTGLQRKMETFDVGIRQIHIKDVDLVDRCESCHLGTKGTGHHHQSSHGRRAAFVSHLDKELLKVHDPEKFGCTPCHGGNGVALTSVEKAHGYNEHRCGCTPARTWRPGASNATRKEIVTEMADTLNTGREIFPVARLHGLPQV